MKHRSKKILSYIITLAVIAGAAIWVASRFIHLGNVEFTDNAQVRQQIVPVNSRVQGYIKEIRFSDGAYCGKLYMRQHCLRAGAGDHLPYSRMVSHAGHSRVQFHNSTLAHPCA
ncbi:MAG: hypothetical protein K2H15_04015 [Muribaculaceae bacterium]|nr:hypothetical protein [Muribaculaceae bacterium]